MGANRNWKIPEDIITTTFTPGNRPSYPSFQYSTSIDGRRPLACDIEVEDDGKYYPAISQTNRSGRRCRAAPPFVEPVLGLSMHHAASASYLAYSNWSSRVLISHVNNLYYRLLQFYTTSVLLWGWFLNTPSVIVIRRDSALISNMNLFLV